MAKQHATPRVRGKKAQVLQATHVVEASTDSFARFLRGDTSMLRCTLCEKAGGCDCWTKCPCGWTFEKGTKCRNPKCSAS